MIEHLADEHGVLLRRDMVAAGISDPVISKLRRREHVVRIRHGVYVLADRWRAADARGRHLMLAHGTWRLYGDDVALSHTSAALLAGAPSHGLDLGRAHLTHLGGAGERTQASVVHHRGRLLVDEVTRHRGRWVTAPVRTALDHSVGVVVAFLDAEQHLFSTPCASRGTRPHGEVPTRLAYGVFTL